jgi:hypothetical protein
MFVGDRSGESLNLLYAEQDLSQKMTGSMEWPGKTCLHSATAMWHVSLSISRKNEKNALSSGDLSDYSGWRH